MCLEVVLHNICLGHTYDLSTTSDCQYCLLKAADTRDFLAKDCMLFLFFINYKYGKKKPNLALASTSEKSLGCI